MHLIVSDITHSHARRTGAAGAQAVRVQGDQQGLFVSPRDAGVPPPFRDEERGRDARATRGDKRASRGLRRMQ